MNCLELLRSVSSMNIPHISLCSDTKYGVVVKNAFKIYNTVLDKWYLVYCRTSTEKERWMKAFREERLRVLLDRQNGFNLPEFKDKMACLFCSIKQKRRSKDKGE